MISHNTINRGELREIAERTQAGETVGMTVRQLLRLFGTRRRGYQVQWFIDKELQKFGLDTKPSFKMPREYDAMVWFVARPTEEQIEAALGEFEKTTRGRDWRRRAQTPIYADGVRKLLRRLGRVSPTK
ncbi:MAG: hypothetical protein OXH08_07230 [Gammaproteobacteria bacterium]|nr:hypothetical protein [Gammaproteobacteria bacterium]MDE0650641.1 hypothetical protein [Gammaproteobacteria bacterium]